MNALRTLMAAAASLVAIGGPAMSAHAQDAEAQVYGGAKTCDGLKSYLKVYPQGRFRTLAETRIAKDCAASPKPPAAPKPKPKPAPAAAPADPCVQARADWTQLSASEDLTILRSYVSGLPKACGTQKSLAQARIDAVQKVADDAKRVVWKGVPEFDGTWVLEPGSGTGCGNLPWTYKPNGQYIRRIYASGSTRDLKVLTTIPPTLGVLQANKGRSIIEGARQRVEDENGKLACYLKRQ